MAVEIIDISSDDEIMPAASTATVPIFAAPAPPIAPPVTSRVKRPNSERKKQSMHEYWFRVRKPARRNKRKVDISFEVLPDSVITYVMVHGRYLDAEKEVIFINEALTEHTANSEYKVQAIDPYNRACIRDVCAGAWYNNFSDMMIEGFSQFIGNRGANSGPVAGARLSTKTAEDKEELRSRIGRMMAEIGETSSKWADQLILSSIIVAMQ